MTIPGSASSMLLAAAAGGAVGYQIERSLRFESSDSAYLSRTPASAGSSTWTFSCWIKITTIENTIKKVFGLNINNGIFINNNQIMLNDNAANNFSVAFFRDLSAWYHLVVRSNGTANAVWVNNVQQTLATTNCVAGLGINGAVEHRIGKQDGGSTDPRVGFNGYLADIHFIDGQALTPSSFGEFDTNGVWQPIDASGLTYGTNGFHLPFSDNSTAAALGTDTSGNSNTWTVNNLSVTAGAGNDSLVDSPTNYGTDTGVGGEVRGNYATLNPLQKGATIGNPTNGNLEITNPSVVVNKILGTIGVSSGKWYWECSRTGGANGMPGIARANTDLATYVGGDANSWGYYNTGVKYNNATSSSYGASYANNDVIGIAFDADNGTLVFYKNGVSQGTAFSGLTSGPYFPAEGDNDSGVWWFNFGQRQWAYAAPAGFKALCTQNLPTPLIEDGSTVMDVKLYTGNGSTQTISGLNFSPDLVWIKGRSGATDHALYDTVRGVQKQLESNTTTDETTESTGLTAFNSDGFALGALAQANTSSATYAAWCWNESVSAGFDIVTYTGNGSARTIAHSLGVAPSMIIVKARTTASTDQGWPVYHSANTAAPETDYLLLNSTAATADLNTVWNDTAPTSSVFSVGTNALVNANADTYVAYCFAPVSGYSSGFSYTGNGSADGSFVYLGFRPRLILLKCSSTTGNWTLLDTAREGYNVDNDPLYPNLSNAEGTTDLLDITSNGFKLRTTDASVNSSGATYVGYAWAETPFAYSRAR